MKALRMILASILAIILYVTVFAEGIFYSVRYTVSTTNITEVVKQINISEIVVREVEVPAASQDAGVSESDVSGDTQVVRETVTDIVSDYIEKADIAGISRDDVEKILSDEEVNAFVGDKLGAYVNYYLTGEGDPEITKDEVMELVNTQAEKYGGRALNEEETEKLETYLEESGITEIREQVDKMVEVTVPVKTVETVQKAMSPRTLFMLLGAIILMAALIFVLNLDKIRRGFLFVGIPCLSAGASLGTLIIGAQMAFQEIKKYFGFLQSADKNLVSGTTDRLLMVTIISLVVGVVMIIAFVVMQVNAKDNINE